MTTVMCLGHVHMGTGNVPYGDVLRRILGPLLMRCLRTDMIILVLGGPEWCLLEDAE